MRPQNKIALLFLVSFWPLYLSAEIEVLNRPAIQSALVEKSLLVDLIEVDGKLTAVGSRGHIIQWTAPGQWQQDDVPVSVLLTAVTALSDGTRLAVGHDSAIIVSEPESSQWTKVFDGYQLLDLKIALFEKQMAAIQEQIDASDDADQIEELRFQLEELSFSLEDTEVEKQEGPNKPLLSIASNENDEIFVTGAYGTLLFSNDRGASWKLLDDRLDNPQKFHLNSIISSTQNRMYIVGESGTGFASFDGGESWTAMDMPYGGTLFGIAAQANTQNLIAFGLQGNVMVSNDSGASWNNTRLDTSASLQGGLINSDGVAYVVGHGGLVIDFDVTNIDAINIRKHPSGAAFAKPLIYQDSLKLVGQYGIVSWSLNNKE